MRKQCEYTVFRGGVIKEIIAYENDTRTSLKCVRINLTETKGEGEYK